MRALILTVDLPSANSDEPDSNQASRIGIFLPDVVLRLTKFLLGDYC